MTYLDTHVILHLSGSTQQQGSLLPPGLSDCVPTSAW